MEVDGIEKLTSVSPKSSLLDFRTVKSLRFCQEESGAAIELEMISGPPGPELVMRLRFTGVVGLRLEGFGSLETRIMGFDVVDIRDKGWEGLFWDVLDYEDDTFNFYAKTAEIVSVEPESAIGSMTIGRE